MFSRKKYFLDSREWLLAKNMKPKRKRKEYQTADKWIGKNDPILDAHYQCKMRAVLYSFWKDFFSNARSLPLLPIADLFFYGKNVPSDVPLFCVQFWKEWKFFRIRIRERKYLSTEKYASAFFLESEREGRPSWWVPGWGVDGRGTKKTSGETVRGKNTREYIGSRFGERGAGRW